MKDVNRKVMEWSYMLSLFATIPELVLLWDWLHDKLGLISALYDVFDIILPMWELSVAAILIAIAMVHIVVMTKDVTRIKDPGAYPVRFIGFDDAISQLIRNFWYALWVFLLGFVFVFPPLIAIAGFFVLTNMVAMILAADAMYCVLMGLYQLSDMAQYRNNTLRFVCPECGRSRERPSYFIGPSFVEGLRPSLDGLRSVEMVSSSYPCYGSAGGR